MEKITREQLGEIIAKHREWEKTDGRHGEEAKLNNLDFSGEDLSNMDFSYIDFEYSDFEGSNLSGANLEGANLSSANLKNANLHGATLYGAILKATKLMVADLRAAKLSRANFWCAELMGANLSRADIRETNFRGADLSGVIGLQPVHEFLKENFEFTAEGIVAYKVFNLHYDVPEKWEIKPGSVISENVDFSRAVACGCGINVGTLNYTTGIAFKYNTFGKWYALEIWKVLIRWEWVAGICVPYGSNGAIRCECCELVEVVTPDRALIGGEENGKS